MRLKRFLQCLALLSLLSASSCWADVRLTDQEFQELEQILTELATIGNEQEQTLIEQQTIINDLQKTTEEQEILYKKEKRSLVTHGIASSVVSLIVGILLGALLI